MHRLTAMIGNGCRVGSPRPQLAGSWSQNRATKRGRSQGQEDQVGIIVSGSVAISTTIQMISPTPRAPVSHGAINGVERSGWPQRTWLGH